MPVLADMAKGRLREKLEALEEALLGVVGSHQRFMLATQLRRLSTLDADVERLGRGGPTGSPAQGCAAGDRYDPRRGPSHAETIVADATPGHLASCRGQSWHNRSADKSKRSPVKKGNASLQRLWWKQRAAARTKYLGPNTTASHIGANRAAMAVAHSIAVAPLLIKNKVPFGHKYFEVRQDRRHPQGCPPTRTAGPDPSGMPEPRHIDSELLAN